jgi:uncharacterized membrane-anchored protein YjiN (DUF445 family)
MTMRQKANRSLLLLGLFFIMAACCLFIFPDNWWVRMLLYTGEAGLVGALADLFAVTVLFRHPFGLKWFPHTAIIPRNRDKLIEGVATMVEQQLLSKHMLKKKVSELSLVEVAIAWVDRRPTGSLAEQGWKVISQVLSRLDMKGLSQAAEAQARAGIGRIQLSPYAGKALRWLLRQGSFQAWLTTVVVYAEEKLSGDDTRAAIRELLGKEKEKFVNQGSVFSKWLKKMAVEIAESTNALNLDDAANVLHGNLKQLIQDLKSPEHELRQLIERMLYELADTLEQREDVAQALNEWRDEMLDKISLLPSIEALFGHFRELLVQDPQLQTVPYGQERTVNQSDIRELIGRFVQRYWEQFKSDEQAKAMLEQYAQRFAHKVIDSEHAIIGVVVRKTLESFTEQRLVEFIESKVETDLQRIRINGAYIGAALGAAFYLILYGVYEPLLLAIKS